MISGNGNKDEQGHPHSRSPDFRVEVVFVLMKEFILESLRMAIDDLEICLAVRYKHADNTPALEDLVEVSCPLPVKAAHEGPVDTLFPFLEASLFLIGRTVCDYPDNRH